MEVGEESANSLRKRKREGVGKDSLADEKEKELKRQNDTLTALAAQASSQISAD